MQWLAYFWVDAYSSTKRHSEKESIVAELIHQWVHRKGTFVLYHRHPASPQHKDPHSSKNNVSNNQYHHRHYSYQPLWVSDPVDRETIGFYTKQRLSKMSSKLSRQRQAPSSRNSPKLNLLVAMLTQAKQDGQQEGGQITSIPCSPGKNNN